MNVEEFSKVLEGRLLTGDVGIDNEVTGIYCCDLLSWVMSHVNKGDGWITVHTHMNVIAVAALSEVSCVIIPEGIEVEEATIAKAVQQGIPIVSTGLCAYCACTVAYDCGI